MTLEQLPLRAGSRAGEPRLGRVRGAPAAARRGRGRRGARAAAALTFGLDAGRGGRYVGRPEPALVFAGPFSA